MIWIETEAAVAKVRIAERNDARDEWKLANWDAFAQRARFGAPEGSILVVRNRGDATLASLEQQAINLLDLR